MKAYTLLPPPKFLLPGASPEADEVYQVLYTYCKIDVKSEEELDDALPDLIPAEQEIWHLNQTLNWRGLRFDEPTVKKIVEIMKWETQEKLGELDELTLGLVSSPGAIKSILEFLEMEGVELPNLRAKTVSDALATFDLPDNSRQLLELRKALSLTSTKKYQTFLARGVKGRVHDILMYHGASTGRDTGTGLMPHNFPRGLIKNSATDPYSLVKDIVEYDTPMLKFLYGDDALGLLFSAVLRNMILPDEGAKLFVADFSKIEVAVCWWLSANEPGLKILTGGGDPYVSLAVQNTGKSYKEIERAEKAGETWAVDARQLAKAQILGCQFGMGWKKFMATAWDFYRLKLSEEQAQLAVKQYRELFHAVPAIWKGYEYAAIQAVENPGKNYHAGRCTYFLENNFLWSLLPSGRRLAYRDPQITFRDTDWGTSQKTLEFWAVNSKTKKWNLERTWGGVLCENNTQAVARDLMMPAMVRLEKRGYQAALAVHDEALTSNTRGSVSEFVSIMCEPPAWAKGLPIEAKGWEGPRYRR